ERRSSRRPSAGPSQRRGALSYLQPPTRAAKPTGPPEDPTTGDSRQRTADGSSGLALLLQLEDEVQDLGHGLVELLGDLLVDVELVERLREGDVAQDGHARRARDVLDLVGVLAHALGDDDGRAV